MVVASCNGLSCETGRRARDRLHGRRPRHPRPLHRQPRVPVDPAELRRHLALVALVGAQRLRDRLRRAAHPGRPARRSHEPQERVPARRRDLHGRLGVLRCRERCRAPRRRARPAGGRAPRCSMPCSLGLLLAAYPPERRAGAVRIWAAIGWRRRSARPRARRVAGRARAGAGSSSSTCRSGSPRSIAGRRFLPSAPRVPEPLPDLFGALVLMGGSAALTLGLVEGPQWGWGAAPRSRASRARCCSRSSCSGQRATAARRSSSTLLRVRAFRRLVGRDVAVQRGFAAMLLSSSSGRRTAWGWSASRPVSRSRRGR